LDAAAHAAGQALSRVIDSTDGMRVF
jgi:hypothetical protein